MKRTGLLAIMLFGTIMIIGQNIQITFTGTGESTVVDSVTATNLTTNQSVTLPGNETLILEQSSGIIGLEKNPMQLKLFPNPFDNTSTLTFNQSEPGRVQISASNLLGQVVFKSDQHLEAGQHSFNFSLNSSGVFLISIIGENERSSSRAICTEPGSNSVSIVSSDNMVLKSQQTTYSLVYSPEHVMHFECQSDKHTTISTDSPSASQNYELEFIDCTDPDGRTYKTVKIGEQLWMAENLAYLPEVQSTDQFSYYEPCYLVYGFEGSNIEEARQNENYKNYGVLYNLESANTSCPDGWRLPYDDEWVILELYLGMDAREAFQYQYRGTGVGSKLKQRYFGQSYSYYWETYSNNYSGFNASAGGYWFSDNFLSEGEQAWFWIAPGEFFQSGHSGGIPVRSFYDYSRGINRSYYFSGGGLSVRCIKNNSPEPAEVSTNNISEITGTTSKGGGKVFFRGGTDLLEKGICWSTEENPTVQDHTSIRNETGITYTCQLSELLPRTTYYVRAYVKNVLGTFYGQQESFITVDGGFTDSRDQRVYGIISIDGQDWMADNLAFLPEVSLPNYGDDNQAYYYVPEFQESNPSTYDAKKTANYAMYGVLYNWEAAMTACPAGWHLPTDEDWMKLETSLGMSDSEKDKTVWRQSGSVGKKLKSTNLWIDEGNGINSVLFRAVPAGSRTTGGNFSPTRVSSGFWSSNENDSQKNWHRRLYYSTDGIKRDRGSRSEGFSVRCVKDE